MDETYRASKLRLLPIEERRAIEDRIKAGDAEVVYDSQHQGFFERMLSFLDPQTRNALLESARTTAETSALQRVAEGNVKQLRQLGDMIDTIHQDPQLMGLLTSEIASMLQDGETLDNLPTARKLELTFNAMTRLTSWQARANEYEKQMGDIAARLAQTDISIEYAKHLEGKTGPLQAAQQRIGAYNDVLQNFLPIQRRNAHFVAEQARIENAKDGLMTANRIAGQVGGWTGGSIAGTISVFAYTGRAIEGVATEHPIPMLGAIIAPVAYGFITAASGSSPNFIGTVESIVIGMVVLPTAIGVVNGLRHLRQNAAPHGPGHQAATTGQH